MLKGGKVLKCSLKGSEAKRSWGVIRGSYFVTNVHRMFESGLANNTAMLLDRCVGIVENVQDECARMLRTAREMVNNVNDMDDSYCFYRQCQLMERLSKIDSDYVVFHTFVRRSAHPIDELLKMGVDIISDYLRSYDDLVALKEEAESVILAAGVEVECSDDAEYYA